MNGKGGVYIKKLIEDGGLKEDFQIELLGIFPKKECLDKETELAKTTLFPKGLNGNAGRHIEMTDQVKQKLKKPKSEEHKQKISKCQRGITRSKESNKKRSDTLKRKNFI